MVRPCSEEGLMVQPQLLLMRMLQNLELAVFQTLRGGKISSALDPASLDLRSPA